MQVEEITQILRGDTTPEYDFSILLNEVTSANFTGRGPRSCAGCCPQEQNTAAIIAIIDKFLPFILFIFTISFAAKFL